MPSKINFIQIFGHYDRVSIPLTRRDYVEGRSDAHAAAVCHDLLETLYAAVTKQPATLGLIYGVIDDGTITPLDGQQRLTTLFLLYWYAAKKAQIPPTEYQFLRRFSYETRSSSHHFCEKLIDHPIDPTVAISTSITDQAWFLLSWQNDPTIRAMLAMLDAIDAKFKSLDGLWNKLTSNSITFSFLPVKNMGSTDALYLNINSRGKPLSEFEIFKAVLESELEKTDRSKARAIAAKLDGQWTDLLWPYKATDGTTDAAFLRCFQFVCQTLCYQAGDTPSGEAIDYRTLLNRYFHYKVQNVESNIAALESFFDSWSEIATAQSIPDFFKQYLTFTSAAGKTKLCRHAYHGNLDLFRDQATSDARDLSKFALFYAFTLYVKHRAEIPESDFRRRIRIVHNLIVNSAAEISDNPESSSGNRMPAILHQIDQIILHGEINQDTAASFNTYQLEEEVSKLWLTTAHPELASSLSKLEDHELLDGQIGIVGVDNTDLYARFIDLFQCSLDKVNRALMATGYYGQKETLFRSQCQLGSSAEYSSWRALFHHGPNEGYENTKAILAALLNNHQHSSDEVLDEVAADFLTECEKNQDYNWRYYYVKYSAFRPNDYYGKYFKANHYDSLIITTKNRCTESAYSPFLKAVQESVEKYLYLKPYKTRQNLLADQNLYYNFDNHNIRVYEKNPEAKSDSVSDAYILKSEIPIEQTIDSIDTEDRVQKMVELITNPQPK